MRIHSSKNSFISAVLLDSMLRESMRSERDSRFEKLFSGMDANSSESQSRLSSLGYL